MPVFLLRPLPLGLKFVRFLPQNIRPLFDAFSVRIRKKLLSLLLSPTTIRDHLSYSPTHQKAGFLIVCFLFLCRGIVVLLPYQPQVIDLGQELLFLLQ